MKAAAIIVLFLAACDARIPPWSVRHPAASAAAGAGPLQVWTQHNDNDRTGANLRETALDTWTVDRDDFGKLFSLPVDGWVWTQPLYLADVTVGGSPHNVLFVGTDRATLYAFDADSAGDPLWNVSLGTSFSAAELALSSDAWGPVTDPPRYGINSTPVIDPAAGTIFVVVKSLEEGRFLHRLHALDVSTGAERPGSPVAIGAQVAGQGDGSADGLLTFDQQHQFNRPSLLLSGGSVYVAFASHADVDPYHGWVLGYDAGTLLPTGVFNTSPNSRRGGIWQSGQAPAADADGDIYLATGNGTFQDNGAVPTELGDSVLRLHPHSGALALIDWFTPFNQAELDTEDLDLGVGGPLLVPGSRLLVNGSKTGQMYLLNRDAMGHYSADHDAVLQVLSFAEPGNATAHLHGGAVYWNGPDGPQVYLWAENNHLRAYALSLSEQRFNETPSSRSDVAVPEGMPGAMLSFSADGATPGTGIVWALHASVPHGERSPKPGILRAFDAQDLSRELWNSDQADGGRDVLPTFPKFTCPTIANGKVYVATFSNEIEVYGLLAPDNS